MFVFGSMTWQGTIRFINTFPSQRRGGLFPLISVLSVEGDGVIDFKVSECRSNPAAVYAVCGGWQAGPICHPNTLWPWPLVQLSRSQGGFGTFSAGGSLPQASLCTTGTPVKTVLKRAAKSVCKACVEACCKVWCAYSPRGRHCYSLRALAQPWWPLLQQPTSPNNCHQGYPLRNPEHCP